jgi:hypothetical protein
MAPAKPVADQTHDLDSRADIHDLVVGFYREVVFDELLEPVFGEVAEVDWALHIPKLIDYWCRVLLRQPGYGGSILEAHHMCTTSSRSGSNTSNAGMSYGPEALTHVGRDLSPTWPRSMLHGLARRWYGI